MMARRSSPQTAPATSPTIRSSPQAAATFACPGQTFSACRMPICPLRTSENSHSFGLNSRTTPLPRPGPRISGQQGISSPSVLETDVHAAAQDGVDGQDPGDVLTDLNCADSSDSRQVSRTGCSPGGPVFWYDYDKPAQPAVVWPYETCFMSIWQASTRGRT